MRVVGLHEMTDALVVPGMLEIQDSHGFFFSIPNLQGRYKWKKVGSSSGTSRSRHIHHFRLPLASVAA